MALRIDVIGQTHELLYLFPLKEFFLLLPFFFFTLGLTFVGIGNTVRS